MPTPDLLDESDADAALDETIEQLEAEATDTDGEPAVPDAETDDQAADALLDASDDLEADADVDDTAGDTPDTEDVNVEEIELDDDDFGDGGDLFSGVEGAEGDGDGGDDAADDEQDDPNAVADLSGSSNSGKLQETINEGAARLAVVGLDEGDQKDALETEFVDVFASFRLGFYGSQFANEYLFAPEDGDVDPAWALLGTVLVCAAFSITMRPDTEDQLGRMRSVVGNLGGTGGAEA